MSHPVSFTAQANANVSNNSPLQPPAANRTFKGSKMAWMVWLIASFFYSYQYVVRVMPNVMATDLMKQFDVSTATFGQFSGVYYLGYSLIHLPMGMWLDRFGPKIVMPLCMLAISIGLLPTLYSDSWALTVIGRVLIGIGSSAAILGLFKILRMAFVEGHFKRMLSFSLTIGLLGAIYGGDPMNYLCQLYGYQVIILGLAVTGILFAVASYISLPTLARVKDGSQDTSSSTPEGFWQDVKVVMLNKKIIICCVLAGLMVGPLEGFADAWGKTYLMAVYDLNSSQAARLSSMIFVGMCFGSPLITYVGDKLRTETQAIVMCGAIMAAAFIALCLGALTVTVLTVVFLIVGSCCVYQVFSVYKVTKLVNESYTGLTTAAANMIVMIFGYAFHSIIGLVVSRTGGVGSIEALNWGISVVPIALVIGTVGFIAFDRFFSSPGLHVR